MSEMNEIEAAALEHKRVRDAAAAAAKQPKSDHWPVVPIAIGVGVGSAALAAALLYANWPKRKK